MARCPLPATGPRTPWRKRVRSSAAATLLGRPHHSADDPVINPGHDAIIRGKFAYGTVSKDLQDEEVALWLRMRPCGEWKEIGRALTDSDGRIDIAVPRKYVSGPGAYPYQLVVRGDLSRASGTLYVLRPDTRVVIFDVDGTLTTGDGEILEQMALGADPDMREGANKLVNRYAEAGYVPIYITGRPYILRRSTASWLRRHAFPPGPLITTDRFTDARPGNSYVGRFKRNVLAELSESIGLDIAAAYGNASSDVCAYARAGIAPDRTFIFGAEPKQCPPYPKTQPVTNYVDHAKTLAVQPAAR